MKYASAGKRPSQVVSIPLRLQPGLVAAVLDDRAGVIPRQLRRLSALTFLHLGFNRLTGEEVLIMALAVHFFMLEE